MSHEGASHKGDEMPEQDDFGKDLGLVHQVVVSGRGVGADRNFWASLAHNKDLLEDVVEFVDSWLAVTQEDRKAVNKWLFQFDVGNPLQEKESYYWRTSHCGWYKFANHCDNEVPALDNFIKKASRNKQVRMILGEMHCFFLLFYLYSGLWSYKNRKGVKWMHSPLWSTFSNLRDIVNGHSPDAHTHYAGTDYHKAIMANPHFQQVKALFGQYATNWREDHEVEGKLTAEQIGELIKVCCEAALMQRVSIQTTLQKISEAE